MSKKTKLPKYVQEKFKKPQFKVGDTVNFEFLGESGLGVITNIKKHNDKEVTYTVKQGKYSYPCGLNIKEFRSYYAGGVNYELSKKV